MPIRVTKIYIVDTNDVDEAYELTKPTSDRVATLGVGQLMHFDPNAPTQPMNIPILQGQGSINKPPTKPISVVPQIQPK